MMAFDSEIHAFVAVHDQNCIKAHGYVVGYNDWTMAYYPAGSEKASRALTVRYPQHKGFGEIVHWLDQSYAADTMAWSKHANRSIFSHQISSIILFIDAASQSDEKYEATVKTFRSGMDKVIDVHAMELVPIVYPVRQTEAFGDESERLDQLLGINFDGVQLPQMILIHGATKQHTVFPHPIADKDQFISDLVAYWSIMHLLKSDLSYIQSQLLETQ